MLLHREEYSSSQHDLTRFQKDNTLAQDRDIDMFEMHSIME